MDSARLWNVSNIVIVLPVCEKMDAQDLFVSLVFGRKEFVLFNLFDNFIFYKEVIKKIRINMNCEQELNSTSRTCVFIPEIQDLAAETMSCPDGYRRFDDKSVIPSAPICIQTPIPDNYTCQNPLRCLRPRVQPTPTIAVESYHLLRNAYSARK